MLKKIMVSVTAVSMLFGGTGFHSMEHSTLSYAATQQTDSTYVTTGNAYYKKAKYKEAIASADKALALNSANADAYYLKGQAYAKLKKKVESKANYEKAAFANPKKYYNSVLGMQLNNKTGELSNATFGIKVTPTEDWYYYDTPGLEEVTEVSKILNANKKMKQAEVDATIAGAYSLCAVYKEDPSKVEGSSNLMIMLEPLYMDPAVKTVDDYIQILVNGFKEAEDFKEITSVESGKLNGVTVKGFAVTYDFDGIEISQYYYIMSQDQYAKVIVLTPVNDEELEELQVILRTIKL